MKRFLFVLGCILVGLWVGNFVVSTIKRSDHVSPHTAQVPTPSTTVGIPSRLLIPKLHVDAAIESVGLDGQGRMDVPKYVADVAWYNLGFRPGEKGSSVIDGHYDTVTGAPAVFYAIESLQKGDILQVTDSQRKTYSFMVTFVTSYPYDKLPLRQIFASNDKSRLNLITCAGSWDKTNKNYSNRVVVYSILTE